MRVIAGEKRGMTLFAPPDEAVRPTSDKIKGAIFNSIQSAVAEANVFADCFGGSGAMGIEALSRGVGEAWFFDTAKASIALIEKNIRKAGFESRAHICHCSAEAGIERMAQRGVQGDVFFMDPPYAMGEELPQLMERILQKGCISDHGIMVIETEKGVRLPEQIMGLSCVREKHYGITAIRTYEVTE